MTALRVLFIGGNGTISAASSRLAIERGHDLTLLNRGVSAGSDAPDARPAIEGARSLIGDAGDPDSLRSAVAGKEWDVVVNFRSFTPAQAAADVEIFDGAVGQYVYISSASAYAKPVEHLPITESTPLKNPFWQYSRDKIASEDLLVRAWRDRDFPATIVRPSHTYDERSIPIPGRWTAIDRMRRGLPVPVIGDGTSLWTLTHTRDFAVALVGLLGDRRAVGDTFHITSDEVLTWAQITRILARAAGAGEPELVPVTGREIGRELPDELDGLIGDKVHSVVFDNRKVKALVPEFTATTRYWQGAAEVMAWRDADERRRVVDPELDAALDRLVARFGS
ncbi:NAD-dependent dehydratase [Serinibacter arcticus]|uniref:NAD-dependent dehydratase n=1 Tax=Serinibacter arcticus TaxID=1655435 RepID=A0A2U1ZXC8_9MICO|nr:NAD-dependent epimerase/dehydratase family protein [Serinibacter arcticus]PWD51638.1 NAD-dependent dehydratase [Serinibacter arcticus]